VWLAGTTQPRTEPVIAPAAMTVRVLGEGGNVVRFSANLIPIGDEGWDQVTWFELPPDKTEAPGIAVVRSGSHDDTRYRLLAVETGGVCWALRTKYDPTYGAQAVTALPGTYLVSELPTRFGRGGWNTSWKVTVESGKVAEISFRHPEWQTLTVDPRLPSGGQARDVAIVISRTTVVRNGVKQVVSIPEPRGCTEGPQRIRLPDDLNGNVIATVHKVGYEKIVEAVELTSKDVTWSPVLKPIPRPVAR